MFSFCISVIIYNANKMFAKLLTSMLIFFMLYPKRSLTTKDNEISSPRGVDVNNFKLKNMKLHMKLSEPGFNYTNEEMKKLKIWPGGIIPYFIDDFSFDTTLRERLRFLLDSYNSMVGLKFLELSQVPDDETKRWVLFLNRRGVLSCEDYSINSFTITGVQRVVLGYDCLGAGGSGLASTVLALAGVPPQHNAPDRDNHVTVVMDNIIPEKRILFQVLKNDEWLFHHVSYDFLSAGHYSFHKYTINGSATIIPKDKASLNIAVGEDGLSFKDMWKIRMMYNFISKYRKKSKPSDCSKIFKPGSKFSSYKPLGQDIIIPRVKPAKYLGLSEEGEGGPADEDSKEDESQILTENLSNTPLFKQANKKGLKHKKIKKKKGRDKLDYLPDFDTDFDRDGGRVKLYGKTKGSKKRHALHSKFQLSKLAALSDFDTDKNNK